MVNLAAIGSIILPNVGGCANGLYFAGQIRTEDVDAWFDNLKKPAWTPPDWVFGPAWIALYCGMGYASYLVYEECGGFTEDAVLPLSLYGAQLALNWAWTPIFFGLRHFKLAFLHILALDAAIAACTASFYNINKTTIYYMAPYVAWLSFTSFLTYTLWKLNKDDGDEKIKPL